MKCKYRRSYFERGMYGRNRIIQELTRGEYGTFLQAQRVKSLPAMQETWVPSLGREDPLEKEMATHSSILACRIPWMEEPSRLQSMRMQSLTQLSN